MQPIVRAVSTAVLSGALVAGVSAAPAAVRSPTPSHHTLPAVQAALQHVVVITIDNTHLSDVEQMPAVAKFLGQGTLFANDHTGLIAYTHPDYVTISAGRYPDQTGIVSQSQYDRNPDGTLAGVSFSYWSDSTSGGTPTHLGPAPWTYWTSHGDAVAAVGWADMELESTAEVAQEHVQVAPNLTTSDYEGYALHEPDGSTVFGAPNLPYVENAPLLLDSSQSVGIFNPASYDANFGPDRSLTATAALLEHGVQVVYTYIRSAHNSATGTSLQPGTPAYLANVAHYNVSFQAFFSQLAAHGITPANTDFVITSDEGDHYNPGGELTTGLAGQLSSVGFPFSTSSTEQMVANAAAMLYWPSGTSEPVQNLTNMPGWRYLADTQVLQAIHAAPASNAYDPQLVIFAEPAWYYGSGTSTAITTAPSYWNHGTVAPDVNAMWLGLRGPGVRAQVSREWMDNADVLPTLLQLSFGSIPAGLEGVAMPDAFEAAPDPSATDIGQGLGGGTAGGLDLVDLSNLYKELNAPVGAFSSDVLQIGSTAAIEPQLTSSLDSQLSTLVARRDTVASQLLSLLDQAESAGRGHAPHPVAAHDATTLVERAEQVMAGIGQLDELALQA